MPEVQLPIFPAGCTSLTNEIGFEQRDGCVFYFNGFLPVFSHAVDDLASFRLFTSQITVNGSATQAQVARAFGVPLVTVKRMCKKLRVEGAKGFFAPRPPCKGTKLTPELLPKVQACLDEGISHSEAAQRFTLALAERGTRLRNGHWLREIRKRDPHSGRKHFMDTIKLIACQAESALAQHGEPKSKRLHISNMLKNNPVGSQKNVRM
jgi:hypothetical protein